MTDRADDADWGTAKEITVTGFLASDRADEIQACTRIFEESFRHGADSEYALDVLRAYGDERAGQWVSVEERLPELEKSVLLCVRHGDPKQANFSEAISGYRMTDPEHYTPEEWDNEEGASFPPEYSTDEWGTVTHWMPLPEPPEAP